MVIESKRQLVWRDIQAILAKPYLHGIRPVGGAIELADVLEVLVGSGRATWIASQDIEETIFAESDGVERQSTGAFVVDTGPAPLPAKDAPEYLYAPSRGTDETIPRWYVSQANAFLAAAAQTDDFSTASFVTTCPQPLTGFWRSCEWNVFLYEGEAELEHDATNRLSDREFEGLRIRYWLDEIRFLTDDAAIGAATAKLYKTLPRDIVEANLLGLLDERDREIKINALTSLGYLAYKSPMAPGKPLPPRAERLEDLSLSANAIKRISRLLEAEPDEVVLDHAVCTLRAQSFEGRLREQGADIRTILRRRLPSIESETTKDDIALLLRAIPLF